MYLRHEIIRHYLPISSIAACASEERPSLTYQRAWRREQLHFDHAACTPLAPARFGSMVMTRYLTPKAPPLAKVRLASSVQAAAGGRSHRPGDKPALPCTSVRGSPPAPQHQAALRSLQRSCLYDRGTNKDTLSFSNQYLLKLTYAL